MTQNEILKTIFEDLMSRFIINVPEDEISSIERICFQIEQAHWYYQDFYLQEHEGQIPNYSLKQFTKEIFDKCPLLSHLKEGASAISVEEVYKKFLDYKSGIPVCGAILLNSCLDKVLLVKSYNSKTWTFPRGKLNKNESFINCCVREVDEETGFDLNGLVLAGDFLEFKVGEQKIRFYIVPNIPEGFGFKPKTRKEISDIRWFDLSDLPGFTTSNGSGVLDGSNGNNGKRYYMIQRTSRELSRWLDKNKKRFKKKSPKILSKKSSNRKDSFSSSNSSSSSSNAVLSSSIPILQSTPKSSSSTTSVDMMLKSMLGITPSQDAEEKVLSTPSPPASSFPTVPSNTPPSSTRFLNISLLRVATDQKSNDLTHQDLKPVTKPQELLQKALITPPKTNEVKKTPSANELLLILRDAKKSSSSHSIISQDSVFCSSTPRSSTTTTNSNDLLRILKQV